MLLLRILYILRSFFNYFVSCEEHAILAYHSISNDDHSDITISLEIFKKQLELLSKKGYVFVSIDDLVSWYEGKKNISKKTICLTFDDGYIDYLSSVIPVLKEYNYPSTVFIIESGCLPKESLNKNLKLLSGKDVDMLRKIPGVSVGFHGRHHENLSKISEKYYETEGVSKEHKYSYFAFPGGNYNDQILNYIASAGYRAAFSIKPEIVTKKSHRFLLPRIVVTKKMSDTQLLSYVSCASGWYRKIRRTLNFILCTK